MKIVKKIVMGIVGLVVILLIIGLFVKKEFAVVKEIVISQPKMDVFNYIKYLKNQDHYGVWAKMDPNMKKEYKGTDGTVGFVASWDSDHEKVGKGEQEIKKITEGERLDLELRFFDPFEAIHPAYMSTEAISGTETKVAWGFSGKMPYPMNLMSLFLGMDEMIGNDLQTGLVNLKTILEAS